MEMEVQQDGAAEGSPEEVGTILGLLRRVGLTGPKLALQLGEEEELAHQLADRARLEYKPWICRLVTGQVKDAYDSVMMDSRLPGEMAPPAVQNIMDAVSSQLKSREPGGPSTGSGPQPVVIVVPKLGRKKRVHVGRRQTEEEAQDAEEEKVLKALLVELEMVCAPVLEKAGEAADPARARRALLGKYRPSTVRRYLAYWRWTMSVSDEPPKTGTQLVDYLHAREEEGMGPSVPLSVQKAVAWFETLAGLEQSRGMSSDPLVGLVVRDLLRKLESGAPPRKRAPRMITCFLPALEEIVMDAAQSHCMRAGAWMKLVKVWASLRFDDMAHMRTEMVTAYEGKFAGLMKRTKTTGAGKRVKELPFFISEEAWVAHPNWMEEGLRSLRHALGDGFELVVPMGASTGTAVNAVMPYQEAVAWSGEVMREMKGPAGHKLVPEGWERFWTEHSERSTMTSCLAALGIPKPDRDLLGRWKPEGSDQYVRTYNAVVRRLQRTFAEPIRKGEGYKTYDEGAVLEEMKSWLVEKWNVGKEVASRAVENWKIRIQPDEPFMDLLREGECAEKSEGQKKAAASSAESSSSSDSSTSGSPEVKRRKGVERLDEVRREGFVVVYNRIDRGKLHRGGGCWMAKQRKFKKAKAYDELPTPEEYTSRCRLCWPQKEEEMSSSDSEDEVSEGGAVGPVANDCLYSPVDGEPGETSGEDTRSVKSLAAALLSGGVLGSHPRPACGFAVEVLGSHPGPECLSAWVLAVEILGSHPGSVG